MSIWFFLIVGLGTFASILFVYQLSITLADSQANTLYEINLKCNFTIYILTFIEKGFTIALQIVFIYALFAVVMTVLIRKRLDSIM